MPIRASGRRPWRRGMRQPSSIKSVVCSSLGYALAVAVLVGSSSDGEAHARLLLDKALKPRTTSTGEKTAPCGSASPTNDSTKRAILKAGDTILVEWEETINHPGWYRLAFSEDGVTGFDANVLKDNLPDVD